MKFIYKKIKSNNFKLVSPAIALKARFIFLKSKKPIILVRVFDILRIGITYGLFSEGLKLL